MAINWGAVILATVVNMAIGAVWYSRLLFLNAWRQGMENTMGKEGYEALHQRMRTGGVAARTYAIALVGAFLVSYVMARILVWRGVDSFALGAGIGAAVWLGFVIATSVNTVLFEGRSMRVFAINSAHYLVAFVVTGGILGAWR
jgi:hypothetical protein